MFTNLGDCHILSSGERVDHSAFGVFQARYNSRLRG